jgi:hypothetical protein
MLCLVLCYLLKMKANNVYCSYSFKTPCYACHVMFWNRFPKFCQTEVVHVKIQWSVQVLEFSLWDVYPLCSPILISFFDLSWLVAVNWSETTWLTSQLPPHTCYYAGHSQLSQTLSFVCWDWLLPYFIM